MSESKIGVILWLFGDHIMVFRGPHVLRKEKLHKYFGQSSSWYKLCYQRWCFFLQNNFSVHTAYIIWTTYLHPGLVFWVCRTSGRGNHWTSILSNLCGLHWSYKCIIVIHCYYYYLNLPLSCMINCTRLKEVLELWDLTHLSHVILIRFLGLKWDAFLKFDLVLKDQQFCKLLEQDVTIM